jgi:hypothetical protein
VSHPPNATALASPIKLTGIVPRLTTGRSVATFELWWLKKMENARRTMRFGIQLGIVRISPGKSASVYRYVRPGLVIRKLNPIRRSRA